MRTYDLILYACWCWYLTFSFLFGSKIYFWGAGLRWVPDNFGWRKWAKKVRWVPVQLRGFLMLGNNFFVFGTVLVRWLKKYDRKSKRTNIKRICTWKIWKEFSNRTHELKRLIFENLTIENIFIFAYTNVPHIF